MPIETRLPFLLPSALERLEMGFLPMMEADPAFYGSRFKAREGEFRVEFLTPLTGRNPAKGKRTEIRQLGVPAIPLRFLDYLIRRVWQKRSRRLRKKAPVGEKG